MLVGVFTLLGFGCSFNGSLAPGGQGAVNYTTNLVKKYEEVAGGGHCTISASYPTFTESSGVSESILHSINDDINVIVSERLDGEGEGEIEELAENALQNCLSMLSDEEVSADFYMDREWFNKISYSVGKNVDGVLSLGISTASYMGGAHGGSD